MRLKEKIFGTLTAASMCATVIAALPASAANVGDKLSVGGGQNQHKGNCDGYSYEIWIDTTGGNGSMTLGKGATFKAEWSANVSSGNFLARRGLDFGSQKKATDYPYIGMDYDADYKQTGSASGNSRLCVYGWFENKGAAGNPPLVEYYIIEDWVDWCPSSGSSKTVKIDGADYKIFQLDHTGPTIHGGSETFKQYFSVRQQKRTSGHITVSDHFKAWADQGWGIGNLYEVALNAEGWQSSGVADIKMLDVYTDPSGGTDIEITTKPPVQADANGYYFNTSFEDGADGWGGRASETVKVTSSESCTGSKSLSVSGRTETWNGASVELDYDAFKAGETYAFSAMVMQNDTASEDFQLQLQCNVDGETQYINIAKATGGKGDWVQLLNNSFTIPKGASDCKMYIETADSKTDFFVDDAIGAQEGKIKKVSGGSSNTNPTTPNTPATPSGKVTRGDINNDGRIDAIDIVLLRQDITKVFGGGQVKTASDINGDGQVTVADLVALANFLLGKDKLPEVKEPVVTTTKAPVTQAPVVTTKAPSTPTGGDLNSAADKSFTFDVPGDIQKGDKGTLKKIQYQSKVCGATKSANVWVPAGYSTSQKYNVLYMNHGVFGNEDNMTSGWAVCEMASNFIANGTTDPFIIVFPQMYSGPGGGSPGFGITMEVMDNYDKFLQDMTDSLMPYIEQNYSVYTGQEHTAIAGFSMGGRESLYLTISRPDLFGYCCASSPAPGIVPASDSFLSNHLGSYKADGSRMKESDFKIDSSAGVRLVMIGGGTADSVVGTFPESYHKLFSQNGTPHVWKSFPGKGHDAGVGIPMFYTFFQYLWK